MSARQVAVLALIAVSLSPLTYLLVGAPKFEVDYVTDAWALVATGTGLVLWLWALWDWGNRVQPTRMAKVLWLTVLIFTFYLGASVYFLTNGWSPRAPAA